MRNLWQEFKAFAMSGNVLDLALGFLIGAAFASLVESLAKNVLMQFVAAIAGQPDFTQLKFHLNGAEIKYGAFLTDFLNFLILAFVMFAIVKMIIRIGILKNRKFTIDDVTCPYCQESVPSKALACKWCGHDLVEEMPDLAAARERIATPEQRSRLRLPLRRQQATDPE